MIRLLIACDCCRAVGAEGRTNDAGRPPRAHLLRADLKRQGWRKGAGGSDWCPTCWGMLKRAKRLDAAGKLREESDEQRTERIVREALAQYEVTT